MGQPRDDLRDQFEETFSDAEFPVSSPMDLVPALPNGPLTRFEAGDVSMTAMELATALSDKQEFPYEDVDALVDDIIAGLEDEELL